VKIKKDNIMENEGYLKIYYDSRNEGQRLLSKHGQVEYLTTMHYVNKYITTGMKIIEIGAGTGVYSHKLAVDGYEVTSVELLEKNIEMFNKNTTQNENIKIFRGNALDLNFIENEKYDMTLLLGPMYHLYNIDDQKKAISEALRVTKNNGIIFIAYCMMDASIINYGFMGNNIGQLVEKNLLELDIFKANSTPNEIFQLYRKEDIDYINSNFKIFRLHYVATDLFTNYFPKIIDNMDEKTYELYIKYHLLMCERMDVTGITHHSIDILRKHE
jgi:2-polyprenyl-3-methyl-5-hydroxy-6-metoxy-1,4-benzoquinol methylase